MKDSGVEWVGQIPEEWKIYKIAQVFKQHKLKNEGLVEQNLLSLSYGNVVRRDLNSNEGLLPKNFEGYNIIEENDIVLRMTDLQNDQKSLRVGLNKERGIITSAYITIRSSSAVNSRYGYYYLHAFDLSKGFYGMGAGVRQGVNFNELKKLDFIYPSLGEQQKIASFLDEKVSHINNIIEDTKKSIENLKFYKQSLITETVTKGLDPNIEMKDSGIEWIGDIPNNWSVIPLKYISSLNDENLSNKTSEDYSFKYVDIGSVSFENGIEQMEETNFKSAPSRARRIVRKNDIIISTVRTYLKAIALIKECNDIIVSTGFAVVRPKNYLVDPLFLSYSLKSDYFTEKVRAYSYGIAYPSINSTEIATMEIVLPPKSIQIEIACFLRDRIFQIDSLINEKDKLITKLESYKKSLIYEYVTGKKEVK